MTNILQTLQEQGHDPKRINNIMGGVRSALVAKGKSNYEIDQKLGIAPFDTSGFQELMVNAAREKFGEDAGGFTREIFTLDDFFSAGFEESTISLAINRPSKESEDALKFEDKTFSQDLAVGMGTLTGDLPAMVGGFLLGAGSTAPTGPGALIGGMAGAFAMPAILRTVMMDAYENGTITSFKQFWDLLIETGIEGSKAYITGAATGGARLAVKPLASVLPGQFLPKTATLAAEVSTFTTVGAALEGRVPEPREFALGAATILGLRMGTKSVGFVAKKSRDIYRKVGKRPAEMMEDIAGEPSIREDLASNNIDTPRAYGGGPDMSRRNFLQGSAASAAVLAGGGKLKLADIVMGPTTSMKSTLIFEGGRGGVAILFPEKVGLDMFGSDGIGVKLKGVKDFAEAKEITERLPGSEEPSHLVVYNSKYKEIEFIDISKKSEEQVDLLVELRELDKGEILDTDMFGAHTSLKDMFEFEKNLTGGDIQFAGERVEFITNGRFVFNPETGEMVARDTKFFQNESSRLEKMAKAEEKRRLRGPHLERVVWESGFQRFQQSVFHGRAQLGPVKQLPASSKELMDVRKELEQTEKDLEGTGLTTTRIKKLKDEIKRLEKEEEVKAIADHGSGGKPPPPPPPPKQLPSPEGPSERVGKRISVGETEAKEPFGLHEIYENIFDDLHPLSRTVKALTKGEEINANEDPYRLARNLRGVSGVGDSFLEFGALDYATKSRISEPYRDIIRPIDQRGRLQAFREYVVSKRDIELNKRGIKTGADMKDARRVVKEGKKEFEADAKRQGIFQENLLKYVRDSGIISNEAFEAMREANKDFVPFNRIMDKKNTGGGGLRTLKPIKGIKGSERVIVDPIESILKNAYVLTTLAERNRTMNALIELSDARPDMKIARKKKATPSVTKVESKELMKLLEPYLGKGEKAALSEADISVFRSRVFINDKDIVRFKDGKAEVYEIDADLARAMAKMDREALDSFVRIMALPASLLRTGAILNPEFMARNFAKDTISAFLFGKDMFIPVVDTLIGMGRILGRDNMYKDWVAGGGQFAHLQAIDRAYHQKGMKELLQSLPARNVVRNPFEILRAMSGLVEQGTRVQVFAKRFKKAQKKTKFFGLAKGEGKSRIAAITEAAFEARDVTLDFQKFGAKTRSINAMSAFFNAFLQGPDKMVRAFKDNPVAMTAKVFGGLVLPSALLHLSQRDEKWYQDLPDWERDLYWNFKIGDMIWKFPKPFEVGLIFASGTERMIESAIGDDPQAGKDFLKTLSKSVVPNMMPQALGVPMEAWFNKSIFLDRPIIPRDRVGLLPELQHGIHTSETAKGIARLIGVLPLVGDTVLASGSIVEHIIRGWTGGLGKHALDLVDKALIASGVVPDNIEPTPAALSNIPLIKAFVVRHPSLNTKTIERFYEKFEKQETIMKSFRKLMQEGEIQRARAIFKEARQSGGIFRLKKQRLTLTNLSKMIRRINRIKKIEGLSRDQLADWKRENIDTLYFRMNQVARIGLTLADAVEKSIAR